MFEIENLIAEQREQSDIEDWVMKRHKVTRPIAASLYRDSIKALLNADESNRRQRFKLVLRGLRALYVKAYDKGALSVCANVMHQMREMFDLIQPFVEGGGESKAEHEDRTTEDLMHFAETGEWPEETKRRQELEPARANPLDELV